LRPIGPLSCLLPHSDRNAHPINPNAIGACWLLCMPDHMSFFRIAMQPCLWLMRVDSGGSIAFQRTAEIGANSPLPRGLAQGRLTTRPPPTLGARQTLPFEGGGNDGRTGRNSRPTCSTTKRGLDGNDPITGIVFAARQSIHALPDCRRV